MRYLLSDKSKTFVPLDSLTSPFRLPTNFCVWSYPEESAKQCTERHELTKPSTFILTPVTPGTYDPVPRLTSLEQGRSFDPRQVPSRILDHTDVIILASLLFLHSYVCVGSRPSVKHTLSERNRRAYVDATGGTVEDLLSSSSL